MTKQIRCSKRSRGSRLLRSPHILDEEVSLVMTDCVAKKALVLIVAFLLCLQVLPAAAAADPSTERGLETGTGRCRTVPQITVETETGEGISLEKSDGYVSARISIEDIDGTVLTGDILFKVRGNTTALSWVEKKSFAFKFAEKTDVLGMGKGKKWVVIANTFDPTLLRNYLAFETAAELEIPYTSDHRFVELRLDGSFLGSYVLFEPVQQGADRVDLDIKSNGGMKDFLVEYETEKAMSYPDKTYFIADTHRFIASDPDQPDDRQLSYMQETLSDVIRTLREGTEARIAEKTDVSSFVKYYLLNEYFKPFDFGVSSVFFYYKDGKLYAGPPWDYDLSMGNTDPAYSARAKKANSPTGVFADQNLFAFLAHEDWFMELVKKEYEAHRDYFSHIHTDGGILDTLCSACRETIERNYEEAGWDISKHWINTQRHPDKTYEENYAFLKNWLAERNAWFEEYLNITQ